MSECIITRQNNFNILDISPFTLFGGNWELIKDRFLLGTGNSYTAGSTGDEIKLTLTINEIPAHNHYIYNSVNNTQMLMGTDGQLNGTKYIRFSNV